MKKAEIVNGELYIKFYNRDKEIFFKIVDIVKTLEKRTFNPTSKSWTAPITDKNIKILKDNGFDLSEDLQKLINTDSEIKENSKVVDISKIKLPEIDETKLKGLYSYQLEGVRFLEHLNGRGIIGDDMGLGKTIQALGYMRLHPEDKPVLIITPVSLKENWKREIKKWVDSNITITIINGQKPTSLPHTDVYIINHDILYYWAGLLEQIGFKLVIADECHKFSNSKSLRTKGFKYIVKKIVKIILLSGTLVRNKSKELFTPLNILDSKKFNNEWKFLFRYCAPSHNGYGWEFNGISNGDELNKLLSNYMIRRLKSEVLKDLPPKRKMIVYMDTDITEYSKKEIELMNFLDDVYTKRELKYKLNALKLSAYDSKKHAVVKWIKDFFENKDKLVVFAKHRVVIDHIMSVFSDIAVKIDGSVSQHKRQEVIDSFQNDKNVKLFVGQIDAAGEGITLTKSSNLAFIELDYVPGAHLQAGDRCHRIGQKEIVNEYYLIGADTIEEHIMEVLLEKFKNVKNVLDGETEANFFKGAKETKFTNILRKLIK